MKWEEGEGVGVRREGAGVPGKYTERDGYILTVKRRYLRILLKQVIKVFCALLE